MSHFIGRKEQLERLDTIFQGVSQGKGQTLFIFGESGSGKYALIEHFSKIRGVPFFAYTYRQRERRQFISILSLMKDMGKAGLKTSELERAMSFTSSDSKSKGSQESGKAREALFRDMAKGFASCSPDPIIIMLDNMHWADGETISILPDLAREALSRPVLLVASYVSDKIAERDGGMHPLMNVMGDMMSEELFQAMELGSLSPQETEEMVEGLIGSKPPKSLVFAIFSSSKGNPLFVKEMVEDIIDRGAIDPKDPGWASKVRMEKISLPSSLKDATKITIASLAPSERSLLEVMAIMGSSFNEKRAQQILGLAEKEIFDNLLQLIEKKMVDEESGNYILHHSFIAGAVMEDMKKETRKNMHRKVFESLKGIAPPVIAGHHAMEAEMWDSAAESLLEAADIARMSYAFISGKEAARSALDCAMKTSRTDLAARASLLLGVICYDMGDWNEALPLLMQASKVGGEMAGEAFLHMAHLERNRSRWDDALDNYSRSLELLNPRSAMAAGALRGIGKVFWRRGKQDEALEKIGKAADIAEELGEMATLGTIYIDMGNVYHSLGKTEESVASHNKAIGILIPMEAWSEVARAYNNTGEVYKESGDLATAVDFYEKAIEMGEKSGDKRIRAYALGNAAECHARLGRTDKARIMADEATDYFLSIDEKFVVASMQMTYGIIASREKNWDEAWSRFEQGAASLELLGIKYDLTIILLEYARALKSKGDDESMEKFREILSSARETAKSINATSMIDLIEKEEK